MCIRDRFTIEDGKLSVLDAIKVSRSARAGLKIAVTLAEDGVISREEAVMRVEPRALWAVSYTHVDVYRRQGLSGWCWGMGWGQEFIRQ